MCFCVCVFVLLHTRACQVALSTMRECIARASFVLFRFTGVVFVERPPEAVWMQNNRDVSVCRCLLVYSDLGDY